MDDYFENQRIVKNRKQENLKKQALYSKNKLKDDIQKKIKTTMIGALASIEEHLGKFIGLDSDSVDTDESEILTAYDKCRKEILDKGNKQIRVAMEDIDECYDVDYHGYKVQFDFRRGE